MSTSFSWTITSYLISLHNWCFPVKFTSFLKQEKVPPEVFCKKGALKNFAIFTGKHLCWSLLKRDPNTCFPVNIFKNSCHCKQLLPKQLFQRTLVRSCYCTGSFIKVRYFINSLWTVKLISIQCYKKVPSKLINLCFVSKKRHWPNISAGKLLGD